jgi:hypothetical protein
LVFTSSALGSPYEYPTDIMETGIAAFVAGLDNGSLFDLPCRPVEPDWRFITVAHTHAQALQVAADFGVWEAIDENH